MVAYLESEQNKIDSNIVAEARQISGGGTGGGTGGGGTGGPGGGGDGRPVPAAPGVDGGTNLGGGGGGGGSSGGPGVVIIRYKYQ